MDALLAPKKYRIFRRAASIRKLAYAGDVLILLSQEVALFEPGIASIFERF